MTQTIPTALPINRVLTEADIAAVKVLEATVFGPGRFARTAYRVREGSPALSPFCRGTFVGEQLIASLRFTRVWIGASCPHLMLGPLTVDPAFKGLGFGRTLISEAIDHAKLAGIGLIILVGDLPYYERFGFKRAPPGQIVFPGPVNPARILICEVAPAASAKAHGSIRVYESSSELQVAPVGNDPIKTIA